MTFMPAQALRIVPGIGPTNAKICIVGEAPGAYENQQLKPFVGPAGSVLEQCLHGAGLIKSEVYLTNVVKVQPKGNIITPFFDGKSFTAEGQDWVDQLRAEINERRPNVVVACGATAFAALTGQARILKYRGYFFESKGLTPERKVLPTLHPAAALRGMYLYRYLIAADLKKAKEESLHPELNRPERQLVYDFGSVQEVLEWLDYFAEQPRIGLDIEVLNYELACISFSSDPGIACSIPLAAHWSEQDELIIWRSIQKILGNPKTTKIIQNAIFDTHFLLTRCGLRVCGPIEDTMIAHSCMYSELRKGLDFLGSLYCGTQAYWKDKVHFTNIKEES